MSQQNNQNKKNLIFIHGAWSTPASFNYILKNISQTETKLNVANVVHISYDCNSSQEKIIDVINRTSNIIEKISNENNCESVIIGHSLGGIIALGSSSAKSVSRVITLASPINGLRSNKMVDAFLTYRVPFLKDVMANSYFMELIHNKNYYCPVDVMVARKGFNPAIYEPSDGVVPISTQTKWIPNTGQLYMIDANHHEILQATPVLFNIDRAINS